MGDKRLREKFYNADDQELRFTKEDRNEVFEKIHKLEKHNTKKKSIIFSSKKFTPLAASLVVAGLCIILFIPSILPRDIANQSNGNIDGNANTSKSVVQENEVSTTLLTVKDENNRIPINLLFTYSKDKNMMKILSIPRDTYAPILDNEKTTPYDKLSHAYVNGSGGIEDVRTTISNLFDLPIDYYAVMDVEAFSKMIDSVNGIDYDLQEDIRVRAISKVAFEFEKGTHRLNGEEVLALLMDATVGNELGEKDQLNLINAVINQTINVLPQTKLEQFATEIEGDFPIEQLLENPLELPSIQLVSLTDGMIGSMMNESYYIKFEKKFLNSVSEELTTFN
ncbi:LCP family protein [Sporosarcina newyorkensis]|uniref:Transcriptional attenuator, LytR family n=1 Tax=Sporosarcina newyorkensis TaxID=759851 RepID=A0A1T4XM44_9BACL|nr:LCP family protein [Sporosarcina newyorkensis]SKA90165.1 transcriptional attenuator, LytR family [Sporosarcina newyorkensis]